MLLTLFKRKYSSCLFLEYGGIHFVSKTAVRPCCSISDYSHELFSFIETTIGDNVFDIKKYRKHINKIKKSNRSKNPICKKCGYFEKKKWEKLPSKYLINHRIILSHYGLCNFDCDYCTIPKNDRRKKPEDILPILKDLITKKLVNPKAIVEFSGGEPSLLPGHAEILNLLKNNGNRVVFFTNSSKFSQDIYNYLKDSKGSYIITSIDCGTKELFFKKRGADAFDKVIKNLEKYSEIKNDDNKSKVVLKYIFSRNNLAETEIDNFIEIVEKFQPFKVILTMDFLAVLNNGNVIIEEIYEQVLNLMKDTRDKLLKKGFVVEISSYDEETCKIYYPEGQSGEKRIFRTYLE